MNDGPRERRLDVSALEPCEPLEQTLAACAELQPGQYLHVTHRREPVPLFGLLDQQGLAHHCTPLASDRYRVLIWNPDDPVASNAVQALIDAA